MLLSYGDGLGFELRGLMGGAKELDAGWYEDRMGKAV
jgi:hypothetical protein